MTDRAALEQSAETTMERLERRRKQKRISHASAVGTETRGNVAMLTLPWMNVTENAESKRSLVVQNLLLRSGARRAMTLVSHRSNNRARTRQRPQVEVTTERRRAAMAASPCNRLQTRRRAARGTRRQWQSAQARSRMVMLS
ncbi:hypothetical protein AA0119_g13332 [Alternaria tenuissima]|uniref:Uncharacterized protein n=1 Tax=Alternaria tenuissima TaxID=119927 RepID=A0ABY0FP53_9PLEO|nr:hypothetical protein AA0119_g13332 [Alternaria tenuissima]